jgi:hypothetical protein
MSKEILPIRRDLVYAETRAAACDRYEGLAEGRVWTELDWVAALALGRDLRLCPFCPPTTGSGSRKGNYGISYQYTYCE